jgi:hypothetical protein
MKKGLMRLSLRLKNKGAPFFREVTESKEKWRVVVPVTTYVFQKIDYTSSFTFVRGMVSIHRVRQLVEVRMYLCCLDE